MAVILTAAAAWGDVVVLRNGNRITGKIVREDATNLFIATGGAEMRIARAQVETVERGVAVDYLTDKVGKAEQAAAAAVARGDFRGALKPVEEALLEVRDAMEGASAEDTEALAPLVVRLETARRNSIPPDPNNIRAERLRAEAEELMDRLQFREAFERLQEAGQLAPDRADVQLDLAAAAERLGRRMEAIAAYRQVIALDASTYYSRVNATYLDLLRTEGTRLVNQRRAEDAIGLFTEILLIQGDGGAAVDVADFMARRAVHENKSEEEVLMEVYRFADANDLVDLAFAAVTRLDRVAGDKPEVKALLAETGFLSRFKAAIDSGDLRGAADLIQDNPKLAEDPRMAERIRKLAGEETRALEAVRQMERARALFGERSYTEAAEVCRRVMVDFPGEEVAGEASRLMTSAEFEAGIAKALDKAMALVEAARDAEAEAEVQALLKEPDISTSVQLPMIKSLERRIPLERRADELWMLASASLDEDRFEEALERLDDLAANFKETRSGSKAVDWLRDYRARLLRESRRYQPTDLDYLAAWTDPNFWRAAAVPAATEGGMRVGPVANEARRDAMNAFRHVVETDKANRPPGRSPALWLLLPLGVGLVVLIGFVLRMARPGRGAFHMNEKVDGSAQDVPAGHCRACGQLMAEADLACSKCGAGRALSEDEATREADEKRRSDFDPWKQKIRAEKLNDFEKHFEQAKQLSETSDVMAAIEACREALHEDPHRIAGYYLLADLYERTHQNAPAAECYREILLLDPGDNVVRAKLDSFAPPATLDPGQLPLVLSVASWWLLLFLAIGIDGEAILLRCVLAVLGAVATWQLIVVQQRRARIFVPAKQRANIDIHRPLPEQPLAWGQMDRQARLVAEVVEEHTGVPVPVLGMWRIWLVMVLSVLLLAAMASLAWLGGSWLVLLGWPAGAFLIAYLFEIYPRLVTANAILRHLMEETLSPWADPHVPFKPKGTDPKGEFLVRRREEVPLRWAFAPHPYTFDRQGVLNSIMQVLNRHWAFHKFYTDARVGRDATMPVLAGSGITKVLLVVALLGTTTAAGHRAWENNARVVDFDESMTIGYQYLLEGDVLQARAYFFRAQQADGARVAPHLYAAHAFAAAGANEGARRSFENAVSRATNLPEAFNDYANFLQRQGELREAVNQYERALKVVATNADILSNAGSACFKLQRYQEAAGYLKRATQFNPKHSRAFTTLGLVLEKLKDVDGAREAYETAVQVAPDLPYTKVARERLEANLAPEDDGPLRLEAANTAAAPPGQPPS